MKILDGNGNSDTETTGANNSTVTRFCVGASTYTGTGDVYEFNGRIMEIIAYTRALTDDEIEKVISYCKLKWNIN